MAGVPGAFSSPTPLAACASITPWSVHTASAWNAAPSPSEGPLSLKSQPHLLQEALLDQPHSVLPAAALPQALQACDDCTAMSVHWFPRLASPRYDALDRAEVGPPHLAFSGCSTYTY